MRRSRPARAAGQGRLWPAGADVLILAPLSPSVSDELVRAIEVRPAKLHPRDLLDEGLELDFLPVAAHVPQSLPKVVGEARDARVRRPPLARECTAARRAIARRL